MVFSIIHYIAIHVHVIPVRAIPCRQLRSVDKEVKEEQWRVKRGWPIMVASS